MSPAGEIVVVPFHSKGHTFPATELSLHLASRGLSVTLFLPSRPSSPLHTNINVVLFSGPPPPPPPAPAANPNSSTCPSLPPPPHLHEDTSLEDYLSKRSGGEDRGSSPSSSSSFSLPLLCAVVDVMMSHCIETCNRHGVPVVSFFTSSGCAAALEHAASKLSLEDLGSAGSIAVPGLPEDMVLTASDLIPEPPPPGADLQPPCSASDGGSWAPFQPPHPGCGSPPPPPFGWGHPGSRPPPFPWGDRGGPAPHVAPGHGGGPPPPPRPGHHHHPCGLLRPFRPPPPPPHGRGAGPLRPPTRPPTHLPSPPPEPSEPGTSGDATAAAARRPGGGGGPPRGLGETGAAAALLFNTCEELERPFLDYLAKEAGKPVWGVGPLLPTRFWSTADGPVSDEEARPDQQETTVAEGEVRAWLDSKPAVSVIYISFGTLVGPTAEELAELAAALEESDRPFIWVLQADAMNPAGPFSGAGSYFPDGLARRAGESRRGLVIRGWAPQLTILSHPSTAAFVSHCGWNSTVEALARGVPVLAWPVKGDQVSNAKLVTDRLRIGYPVRTAKAGLDGRVTKEEVAGGIERLMADEEIRARARAVRSIFELGFPSRSTASVEAFVDFVTQRSKEATS